jgi:endo-beta-N-acetylglucosaminidase D
MTTFDSFKQYCEYVSKKFDREIEDLKDEDGEVQWNEIIKGTFATARTFDFAVLIEQKRLAEQSLDLIEKHGEKIAMRKTLVQVTQWVTDQAGRLDHQQRDLLAKERVNVYAGIDFIDQHLTVGDLMTEKREMDELLGLWAEGKITVETDENGDNYVDTEDVK